MIILFFSVCGYSQTKTVRQAEKKKQEIVQKQKKAYDKARKKAIKEKFDMQSESTKKQMKESRKRAKRNNSAGRQPFIQRLFDRKKKAKHR